MPKASISDALDAKVSTNDPSGSAKSIAYAIGGVALFIAVVRYGMVAGDWVTDTTDSLFGTNAGSGGGITFDGAP